MKALIILILALGPTMANAALANTNTAAKKVLISVGDMLNHKDHGWKKQTCLEVYQLANDLIVNGVDVTCREFDTANFHDKVLADLNQSYDFHLRILRDKNDNVEVDATHWSRSHATDFTSLGWKFKENSSSKITKQDAFIKAMANFFFFVGNEEAYKAGLLVNGAAESNEIEYDQNAGVFRDKFTNLPISVHKAYSIFENESPRKKNYLRTGVEIGVLLSSAMAIYYKSLVFNQQDFDYGFREGIRKKFNGEAVLFDDNDKMSNYGHVYAGVLYYQVARSNGYSSLESFLIAQASSAVWEFMEYHEVFSINDQILTPIGGYVIGEASYQIACALNQKNSLGAKALGYAVNPTMALNHTLDHRANKDKHASQPDCKKPRWSDISLHIGLEKGQKGYEHKENNTINLGMKAQVINIEDYNKEGHDAKLVLDTSMSKMFVEMNGNQGLLDLRVIAQVVMAAYHEKKLSRDGKGQLRGYEMVIGLGSASTYNDRGTEQDSPDQDFFGTINILGANAHANIYYKGFNLRADFAIYGDFSMVKAFALEPLKESRNGILTDQSSVLRKHGYYWGMGATTLSSMAIEKGRWTVGYIGQHSTAKSINERNRIDATVNDSYNDSLMSNRFYVSYTVTKNLKVQLAHEQNNREGSANKDQFRKRSTEKRIMGSLVYKF